MTICNTRRTDAAGSNDAFGFAAGDDLARGFGIAAALMFAPWRAYWTVAMEAFDPDNYRL